MDHEVDISAEAAAPQPPRRLFTLDSANGALVLVRKIVIDLVCEYARVLEFQEIVELEHGYGQETLPAGLGSDFSVAVDRVRGYMKELEEVGVELKDFKRGLVDFPARVDGKDVCFCWQLGEEGVQYWHRAGGGLAGRRPVAELSVADPTVNTP